MRFIRVWVSTWLLVLLTGVVVLAATRGSDVADASAAFSAYLPFIVKGYVPSASLNISNVSDNSASFPNAQIPKYEKLEITFQVDNTVASNYQWPYDENPPAGVPAKAGITVDAEFSQDNFQTIYTVPAFYYQDFDHQIKSGREWFYPNGKFAWKVRFAPNTEGVWKYRLVAHDASGTATSTVYSISVASSSNPGFVRVSPRDPRYFEFDDGRYFPGLGYNMSYNHINWVNPTLDNLASFQAMSQNGIQLVRIWLSQWAIYGSAWNPWYGLRDDYDGYIPRAGLAPFSGNENDPNAVRMKLAYAEDASGAKNTNWFESCRFIGDNGKSAPALKQNTVYHFRVRYRAFDISGPRNTAYPNYGFVVKVQNPINGNWHHNCYEPGTDNSTGQVISAYAHNTTDWSYLEGDWNFGATDFLPNFYLALENVNALDPVSGNAPSVYIDTVEIREKFPDGSLGANIVSKPSMQHDLYFEQRNSFAFDKVLDLARRYGLYLKLVIFEKNDVVFNWIDYGGNYVNAFDNDLFYGDYRNVTKIRWLQQAWWRYLQARWGYSPNIHSWELLNEGDPYNDRHYALADELGKYMHQFQPNQHLVTTSFWHDFPRDQFWANPSYPNVDYADVHQYVAKDTAPNWFNDTLLASYSLSNQIGAKAPGGAGKPTMRGETGFTDSGTEPPTAALAADTAGVWLHKFVWSGINAGGILESYWYDQGHIYGATFDHRPIYNTYFRFIKDVPLNNGNYVDLGETVSNPTIWAIGQKDVINGKAHLWIDNSTHTWSNVVKNPAAIIPQTGTVTFSGMPEGIYTVTWYDTYSGGILRTESKAVDLLGAVSLNVTNLQTDVAVKVEK